MYHRPNRRDVLLGCSTAVLAGLAGCTGASDDRENGTGSTDETGPTDPDGTIASELESYAYEIHSSTERESGQSSEMTVTGHVTAEGNYYQQFDQQDGSGMSEIYHVDGTTYLVSEYGCQSYAGEGMEHSPFGIYQSYEEFSTETSGYESDGTTTIDGQEVYVYEFDYADSIGAAMDEEIDGADEWSTTVYVSTETGYFVGSDYRVTDRNGGHHESSSRLHSFGETFTVDPPADC